MKITRFRLRLAEATVFPAMLVVVDGLLHLSEGRLFWSEFLAGAITAVILVRGEDALRAANHIWPEV